ncbi:hypothetical protein KXD93_03630 [Mucilaginibacter sp. BJC16-A38]|uniref:FISUMP domain-containing protein n=1 Tax=Mucilaginibacter phenanthrenivorans TaxID=1234842 RepID=UPI0021586F47|nr:FISUMP domain-containing protein [Mucilaginibacter phenanthrenivorans]MCR8556713.1 hypothetical protein [Mucilaginibacter phenanthrenivorans]
MKRSLLALLVAILCFSSCKKNNINKTTAKTDPPNTVTINGTLYPTAVIAEKTWTVRNYNGADGVDYIEGHNDTTKGKLYTQSEAKAIKVPIGWRLPSQADYNTLLDLIGNLSDGNGHYIGNDNSKPQMLISTSGWDYGSGTNATGFNAHPAGYYAVDSGDAIYLDAGWSTHLVTSSTYPAGDSIGAGAVWIIIYEDAYSRLGAGENSGTTSPADRGSVRFVKDN